jgi:hypothetical protein
VFKENIRRLSMDNEQYLNVQSQVLLITTLVKTIPLKEFIEAANKADTLGPIFDPSLWLLANKPLQQITALAKGLKEFQDRAIQIEKEAV